MQGSDLNIGFRNLGLKADSKVKFLPIGKFHAQFLQGAGNLGMVDLIQIIPGNGRNRRRFLLTGREQDFQFGPDCHRSPIEHGRRKNRILYGTDRRLVQDCNVAALQYIRVSSFAFHSDEKLHHHC